MAAKKTSKETNNMMIVSIVVGLILFGLGYVVGKTKATIRQEMLYNAKMNSYKQELMSDGEYRKSFMEKMIMDDAARNDLFNRVDQYKMEMKKQMYK